MRTYDFATIGFRPFPETQEFVTIGVVAMDIYNHGDEWIQRMKRLKRLDYRPDQCLLAARAPKDETEHRGEAFRQIVADLLDEDFVCIGEHETDKVLDFARAFENPVLKLA